MQDLTGQIQKLDKHQFAGGGFANVWKGTWVKQLVNGESQSQVVAVKVIHGYSSNMPDLPQHISKLKREGELWSKLEHPYITPFLGVSLDFSLPKTPCLVCPYYENGNLADYLLKVPDADRIKLSMQVAEGISYLHSFEPTSVIHGDIKAANILINDDGDANLTDFGLSRVLEASGFTTANIKGSFRWMAPELFPGVGEEDVPKVTSATDIWAFGMTLIEIFTGRLPFDEYQHDPTVMIMVLQGITPRRKQYPEIHNMVWDLMFRCWHQRPEDRVSIQSIVLALNILHHAKTPFCLPSDTFEQFTSLVDYAGVKSYKVFSGEEKVSESIAERAGENSGTFVLKVPPGAAGPECVVDIYH